MSTIYQPSRQHPQAPFPTPPRNDLAVLALVFGVIAALSCPFNPINVLGFLCGLIGFGLATAAVVVGARSNVRLGVALTALILSVIGAVVSPIVGVAAEGTPAQSEPAASSEVYAPPTYTATHTAAPSYSMAPTTTQDAAPTSGPAYTPAYEAPMTSDLPPEPTVATPQVYTYKIIGTAKASTITYSAKGGNTSQVSAAKLPWSKKVEDPGSSISTFAYVSAQNNGGGTISCQIIGPSGRVISENSSAGEYSIVTCQS